ncbi:MAG: hypothetical protein KGJ86_17545, partial [Chloroflexota bacterium]|nr:hypothetical protein [Chloroflexota bacterium]
MAPGDRRSQDLEEALGLLFVQKVLSQRELRGPEEDLVTHVSRIVASGRMLYTFMEDGKLSF